MTEEKRLVLDANILIRAVFGSRVRSLLETYEDSVSVYIWTEDQDFFGSGIATWTTSNVELYLRDA